MYSSFSSYSSFYAEPDTENYDDSLPVIVPDLTDSSLSTIYKRPTVLLIYAPWCFHCVQFKPRFTDLATTCRSNIPSVTFAQLDATQWPLSVSQFEVQGYPSIYYVDKGKTTLYQGNRDLTVLESWISSQVKSSKS